MYENLLYQTAKSITIITINRPSVRNALNSVTMRELKSAFEEARTDAASRVIILTGSGDKAFVAGADINELAKLSPVEGRDYSLTGQAIFEFIDFHQQVVRFCA